jgi:hypothetical protein
VKTKLKAAKVELKIRKREANSAHKAWVRIYEEVQKLERKIESNLAKSK